MITVFDMASGDRLDEPMSATCTLNVNQQHEEHNQQLALRLQEVQPETVEKTFPSIIATTDIAKLLDQNN